MIEKQFYEEYYSRFVDRDWTWRETTGLVKGRNIIAISSHLDIRSILDVGCGTGAVLSHLADLKFGESYSALDISQHVIDILRKRGKIHGLVGAEVYDGSSIPYPDNKFDMVILSHVIEHLSNPVSLLQESARVGRYLVVEVPLEYNLYTIAKVKIFKSRYRERLGHIQWFSRHRLRMLLKRQCGLDVIDLRMVYIPDEVYFLRKPSTPRSILRVQLMIRKVIRTMSSHLYELLLPDHCIALVRCT